ncbi:hypothetical protein LCGC14_0784030 [marine sediment metagenome]|uniref:DUF4124 domain-containing protein n=1 Tax=marine sediment metagenome TaxID=412755 RepID=A0A0F9SEI5_9ZZZZ
MMLKLNFYFVSFLASLFIANVAVAEIYKWTDDDGQVHYSQQAPKDNAAEVMNVPTPPPISPEQAKRQVDALISQQEADEAAKQQAQERAQAEKAFDEKRKKQCEEAKNALTQYQEHPAARYYDENGDVKRMTEEFRQEKMKTIKATIKQHCK